MHYLPFSNLHDLAKKTDIIQKAFDSSYFDMRKDFKKKFSSCITLMNDKSDFFIENLNKDQLEFIDKHKEKSLQRIFDALSIETKELK